MSAAKRPASNSFGSSQMVVKRQKSNVDINGKAVAVTNGVAGSGALIQAVSLTNTFSTDPELLLNEGAQEGRLMELCA